MTDLDDIVMTAMGLVLTVLAAGLAALVITVVVMLITGRLN